MNRQEIETVVRRTVFAHTSFFGVTNPKQLIDELVNRLVEFQTLEAHEKFEASTKTVESAEDSCDITGT